MPLWAMLAASQVDKLSEQLRRVLAEGFRDLAELDHVNATFAPLHLRYEALGAVQAGGELDLSDAGGLTFIKELLREHGIKIGSTKADFEKNIFGAIGDGRLTREMVEAWLLRVEGWGDQHIYLLTPPPAIALDALQSDIRKSAHAGLLEVGVSYEFPETLAMTSVRLDHEVLAVDWHLRLGAWERAKSEDHQREIDGELYDFRAWRDRRDRSIVRFEWRFGQPYCCLFTQLPNDGDQHLRTLQQVFADLNALGVIAAPLDRVPLSKAVKASTQDDGVVAHSTRMSTPGGYVEFASTAPDAGIGDVEAIRRVRQGVQDSDFGSAEGMLSFPRAKHGALSRDVKATVYGSDGRFRVWVQFLVARAPIETTIACIVGQLGVAHLAFNERVGKEGGQRCPGGERKITPLNENLVEC